MEKIKTLFRSFVRFPHDLLIKRISRQSRALIRGSSFSQDELPVNPHCSFCTARPDLPSVQKQRSSSSFESQEASSVSGAQEKAPNSISKRGDAESWHYGSVYRCFTSHGLLLLTKMHKRNKLALLQLETKENKLSRAILKENCSVADDY